MPLDDCLLSVQLLTLSAPCPSSDPSLVVPRVSSLSCSDLQLQSSKGQRWQEDCSILLTKGLFHEGHFIVTPGGRLPCFRTSSHGARSLRNFAHTTLTTESHSADFSTTWHHAGERTPRKPKDGQLQIQRCHVVPIKQLEEHGSCLCQQKRSGGRGQPMSPLKVNLPNAGQKGNRDTSGVPLSPQPRRLEC